jgi:outer membrane receptor protein involved in Fe transport
MTPCPHRRALLAATFLVAIVPAARADDTPAPVTSITVTAQRFEAARQSIAPDLGASTYTIDAAAIAAEPGGEDAALNQVVLQAPGVAQDSFGQLHIRGEHNGLQYRLDGVILPEGISVFSQSLSPRLADQVELITGALPAQYGLRTAGIIDLTTKQGGIEDGGSVGIYGGSHGMIEPSFEDGGSIDGVRYFVSASYLEDGLGIESPDGRSTPLHDQTQQGQGFAYLDDILTENSKITLIAGTARDQFQIPDIANQVPSLGLSPYGRGTYPSADLNETQRELSGFGVLSYLNTNDATDLRVSLFGRMSSLDYTPDRIGDLIYDGIAQYAYKRDIAGGLQAEGVWRAADDHTFRAGLIAEIDQSTSRTISDVLPVNAQGRETSDIPIAIPDDGSKTALSGSLYAEDEWKAAADLTVNAGLRFDHIDAYRSEGQISPRLNAVWQVDPDTTIHAGYARYFTPPPFELVGAETIAKFVGTSGAAPAGSKDTTPLAERAHYLDVGVSEHVLPPLTVGLDTYWKESRNLIDEGQFGAPIILTPFNYASGRQYGAELSANWREGPFSAYANFAAGVAEGKDIVSSQFNFASPDLAYIATHYIHLDHDQTYTASAGASYKLDDWLFSGDLLFGSGLRADGDHPNGASLPDYVQLNLALDRHIDLADFGVFDARLDVINLLGAGYEIRDGTGVGVGAPQYGPRRGFFVGLSRRF